MTPNLLYYRISFQENLKFFIKCTSISVNTLQWYGQIINETPFTRKRFQCQSQSYSNNISFSSSCLLFHFYCVLPDTNTSKWKILLVFLLFFKVICKYSFVNLIVLVHLFQILYIFFHLWNSLNINTVTG